MKLIGSVIPSLSWTLSGRSVFRAIALGIRLELFVLRNKFFKNRGDWEFLFFYRDTPFKLLLRSNVDIAVLREIYLMREYDWSLPFDPKIIIDLGAHFGDTALYYHLRYPDAKIIAVEPSPENFMRLQKNVTGITAIIPVQAAVGGGNGSATLHLQPSSLGHSLTQRDGSELSIHVPMLTLESLFRQHSILKADLMKFDIEGGEEFLFNGVDPSLFSRAYIGEVHGDLLATSVQDFLDQFKTHFSLEKEAIPGKNRFLMRAW